MKDSRTFLTLLVVFTLFLSCIDIVDAEECSSNTISNLKKTAANIEITDILDDEYNPIHEYYYNVSIDNLSSEFYIVDSLDNRFEYSVGNDDVVYGMYTPGSTVTFSIYATSCNEELLRTIEVTFDYYNDYSTYEECDGIEEFYLCKRNYSGEIIGEEWFLEQVEGYKNGTVDNAVINDNDNFFDEHLVTIFLCLVFIVVLLVYIRRKRIIKLNLRGDKHG